MKENIIIEIPIKEEYNVVNKLAKKVHELHVKFRPDIFVSVDEAIKKDYFEKLIEERKIYVAKIKDIIVGYIIFDIVEKDLSTLKLKRVLKIKSLCIDEQYRRKGISTKLLNFIKNIAKENNCTDLLLNVYKENEVAIKCYEKFGFKAKNITYSMNI